MEKIKVCDFIESSFSNAQAMILKAVIAKKLAKNPDRVVLDFSGITRFTTLFFNFSTGYYLKMLGKEEYDRTFELINLSELGQSTYYHSYNNSLNDEMKDKKINNAILDILSNPNEE